MTIVLPSDEGFPGARVHVSAENRPAQTTPGVGVRDFGTRLIEPIPAVREAAEQCRVDCSLHDATRAFDAFTQSLTSRDRAFEKWPDRFTAEAKRLRDRFAADIPDGPLRDRFDSGFDLYAKAKAVETRGLATRKRIATNRAELDRALAGYGDTISRATNPVSVDFALRQGEEAIRNQVAARVLSDDEGRDLSRRYRADIAARRAEQFTLDDPAEAAKELEKARGGLFSDLARDERRRLAVHARQAAAAQALDAARIVKAEERRESMEKTLRREAFLRDLDNRAASGEASFADIAAAARGGVLDADEAANRIESLENTFAERALKADRVAAAMVDPDIFLDPGDEDDRHAADIHWRDIIMPATRDLPAPERARIQDEVVISTGIAPKPVVDDVLAGLLSPDPASRVANARRARLWLARMPPIPVDFPRFESLLVAGLGPYLDLTVPDARKIELAEQAIEREELVPPIPRPGSMGEAETGKSDLPPS